MSEENGSRTTISMKERARLMRKAAYQKAKEARKKDPRFLAMKEAAKEQRKKLYREVKAKRKEAAKVEKVATSRQRTEQKKAEKTAAFGELMKFVKRGSGTAQPPAEPEAAETRPSTPGLRLVASNPPPREGAGKRPPLRLVEADAEE